MVKRRERNSAMKGLAVAVIVLGVALALVVCCFAAAALAVGRKLRQLGARHEQFLLRGDSVRLELHLQRQ